MERARTLTSMSSRAAEKSFVSTSHNKILQVIRSVLHRPRAYVVWSHLYQEGTLQAYTSAHS